MRSSGMKVETPAPGFIHSTVDGDVTLFVALGKPFTANGLLNGAGSVMPDTLVEE